MKRTLLIINANSGSAKAISEEDLVTQLREGGFDPVRLIRLPDEDIPDRQAVEALNVDVIAILSGDGTIAGVCAALAGWAGALLILPGGTMNLLSRRLHGDLPVFELLAKLGEAQTSVAPVSVIKVEGREVLTGLIAGPSTEWGKVREGLRQLNVSELVEKVPEAWSATTASESVRIEGRDSGYPAIFVEPLDNGKLSVLAFKADGVVDMFAHGIAWLRRDFREGPSDDLGEMSEVTIVDDDKKLGLLVDGEQDEATSPLKCVAGMSSVNFVRVN